MDFKTINDKIVETIKEVYLKQYFKISKMFQIITVGYNASKYKSLQVFKKYGWKINPGLFDYNDGSADFIFEYYEPTIKICVAFCMSKNLKTGVLCEDSESKKGYIDINIDKSNKLFEYVKQLVAVTNLESFSYNECGKIIYNIVTKEDGGYILQFSYPNY